MEGIEEGIEEGTIQQEGGESLEDTEDFEESDDNYNEDYSEHEGYDDYGGSEPVPLGGIYGLFKDVFHKKDSTKVSNLNKEELGILPFNVRGCLYIATVAETFKHPGVAKFFKEQAKIITDTSMSKEGWFTELFVTSKKHASRESSSNIQNLPQVQKKSKWKLFAGKGNQQTQQ